MIYIRQTTKHLLQTLVTVVASRRATDTQRALGVKKVALVKRRWLDTCSQVEKDLVAATVDLRIRPYPEFGMFPTTLIGTKRRKRK